MLLLGVPIPKSVEIRRIEAPNVRLNNTNRVVNISWGSQIRLNPVRREFLWLDTHNIPNFEQLLSRLYYTSPNSSQQKRCKQVLPRPNLDSKKRLR